MRKKLSPLSPTSFNPVITSQTSDSEEHSVRQNWQKKTPRIFKNSHSTVPVIPSFLLWFAGVRAHPSRLRGSVSPGGAEWPPQHLLRGPSSPPLWSEPRLRSSAPLQQRASPGTGPLPLPSRPLQLQSGTQTQEEWFKVSQPNKPQRHRSITSRSRWSQKI